MNEWILYEHQINHLIDSIITELHEQHEKHGNQYYKTINEWFLICSEEFGEIAKGINELDKDNTLNEIIQTITCLIRLYYRIKKVCE